ncbi:N-6 DNA methylase [Methylobacterium sp. WL8]|uniref:Eco57I restriction-modification methylase domain-containing protein n=1 Tax=Methylobacterium sp. WL8 TaxID=2603899 RepID=UPI0011CA8263|nr:N-6 DNA methylase [Methylobacterium sp. WL8]TXN82679.1 SAM-dependent methyltransferase [Methylobacterium sp. WL8]
MASLERTLRKDLEKAVKQARRVAEAGVRKAVEQIGVGEAEAPKHLTTEQRALRNRLRAHGRQLDDRRDSKGVQTTTRLVQECAYEQWHRMLFARFLAETDLLIEPESGMAITLDEVQELAREKATDWLPLVSDFAERMLPQIFRSDDPVLEIALPPETRSEMEDLLNGLTKPVFEADDSLGWVYQFWQSEKKDEVNKSEVKIGAEELPAVTQLFTEDYMVLFLLHNTLGAWWAGKVLASNTGLATSARDEAALRAACSAGDIDWTYLRFVRDTAEDGTEGAWRPAAGVFEGWPKAAKDLTVLDPCMGSGHFLVFALPILVEFRIAEEGLSRAAAVNAALKDNLFGLEIDPRCTQIAAFNLAFAAWRKVGHRPLPQLNLACSGLAIGVTKAEWLKLAEKAVTAADPAAKRDLLGVETNLLTVGLEERIKNGLEALYDLFARAPWLGSLIDPRRAGADIFRAGFDKLEPLLTSIMTAADTDDAREMAVAAQGMAKAAQLLNKNFVLVSTNVPYLGRGKQDEVIRAYCDKFHAGAKTDIATCFIERCFQSAMNNGSLALVSPQNWWYLGSYRRMRVDLLDSKTLNVIVTLGEEAWQSFGDRGPVACLLIANNHIASPGQSIYAIDALKAPTIDGKVQALQTGEMHLSTQLAQVQNPDQRITIRTQGASSRLVDFADVYVGFQNGDTPRWIQNFWEQPSVTDGWSVFQMPPEKTADFAGRHAIIKWDNGTGPLAASEQAYVKGREAWNKRGVIVRQMRDLPASLFVGDMYDQSSSVIVPKREEHLFAIASFVMSKNFHDSVRQLDRSLAVTNATFVKVPFELEKWLEVAKTRFPNGFPVPSSVDPTQWLFDGHPKTGGSSLLVATCRMLGYVWPRQYGGSFLDCPVLDPDGLDADEDGIVCLTALKGEPPAEQRLNALLADAFGARWSAARLAGLLHDANYAGKSLDDWLRDGFFTQHCELFHQRPFIWHIWDGRRDGFHALVNYHRLAAPNGEGRRTLEKLIYSYLGDWIDRQRADQTAGVEGADARLAHAEHLKAELIKILSGEPPYDIFVRWKPLHEQSIGWDPDINDGIRMNIRPFMVARTLNARGVTACILRSVPKIKWDKDRGKEPIRDKTNYPWFWGWDEATIDFAGGATFDGNRWNDFHLSRIVKHTARDRFRTKSGAKS